MAEMQRQKLGKAEMSEELRAALGRAAEARGVVRSK
jgi:hypothetical protein